jgi:D-beta-D-heptose 7-phosphate kinase/D-beta-D-heptose 1-phosphate adenosyltransferase
MSVVFTNGCFDILHKAHVELLNYCASLGTRVVVGLNSDESVKRLKGKERPINNERDRKFILESLRCVNEVIVFSEDTPYDLIKSVRPDVIVKGGDYEREKVVGSDLCEIKIFEYVDGYSTTKTIQNIANR